MSIKLLNFAGVAAILALAACSQPEPQQPVTYSPVYDKVGNLAACVGSDGSERPVPPGAARGDNQRGNPCEPPIETCRDPQYNTATGEYVCPPPGEDCENGYFNQAGELICRPGDDDDDDQPRPDPQEPTGRGDDVN